jgi:DNA-binding GntR family transcriptional regulator
VVHAVLGNVEVDRSALEERVYHVLRGKILARELVPGTLLTIRQVASALDVSPTPVRDALRHLMVDGLLRDRGRLGAEVVGLTSKDVTDIFGARAAFETYAVRVLALEDPGEMLAEMERVLTAWPHTLSGNIEVDLRRTTSLDMEFHRLLVAGAKNVRLLKLYESLGVHLSLIRIFHPEVVHRAETNHQEHQQIARAVQDRDPEAAAAAVLAHITNSRDDILRLMSPDYLI